MKSVEERKLPEFFQRYVSGDPDSALLLIRSLDYDILDAIWMVRKAEDGIDLNEAREIVLASPAYADLADDFWRQQEDFWAVVTEAADEIERDEDGNVSAIFHLTDASKRENGQAS